jgi:glucose/arabinose dehydrogenase
VLRLAPALMAVAVVSVIILLASVALELWPRGSRSALARPSAELPVETVAGGLHAPWALDFAPDGRIFITERPGRIRVVANGQLVDQPWATVEVAASGEAGLMGLALDPSFATNGRVYIAYTHRTGGGMRNRLARLREDPSTGRGVEDLVLVDGVQGANVHDGGRVRFGPDGKLYWTMGDASNAALAQDLGSPNGKIHRLETDGSAPPDNPWPGSTILSYGHRNPQGLAWQPGTGLLFSTEHGPSGPQGCCVDELNVILPGANYGWPLIRGDERLEGMMSPVLHSGTSDTWAPGGAAFVTTGSWAGSMIFAGLRGEALYRVTFDPSNPSAATGIEPLFKQQLGRVRDVVEGPDGALYALTSNRDGRGSPKPDDDRLLRITVP